MYTHTTWNQSWKFHAKAPLYICFLRNTSRKVTEKIEIAAIYLYVHVYGNPIYCSHCYYNLSKVALPFYEYWWVFVCACLCAVANIYGNSTWMPMLRNTWIYAKWYQIDGNALKSPRQIFVAEFSPANQPNIFATTTQLDGILKKKKCFVVHSIPFPSFSIALTLALFQLILLSFGIGTHFKKNQ